MRNHLISCAALFMTLVNAAHSQVNLNDVNLQLQNNNYFKHFGINNHAFPSKNLQAILAKNNQEKQTNLDKLKNNLQALHLSNTHVTQINAASAINFLGLQIGDGITLLEAERIAPKITMQILQQMNVLAVEVANGSLGVADMEKLDAAFQQLKSSLIYAQTINVFNGIKSLAKGNINIQFGNESNSLLIKMPAYDINALGLNNLTIADGSTPAKTDARAAIDAIKVAENIVSSCITITETPAIDDAEALLLTLPIYLSQDLDLLIQSFDTILAASNGTNSTQDLINYDTYLNYLEDAMTQDQTYVSLNGPISMGTGDLKIRIGQQDLPETTLQISLPITNVKMIEMDSIHLASGAVSYNIDKMESILHNFVYPNK